MLDWLWQHRADWVLFGTCAGGVIFALLIAAEAGLGLLDWLKRKKS